MKKVIYIIIRYSILIENSKDWKISNTNVEDYRKMLFEEERLQQHFELFKNITFPSIINQTKDLNSIDFKLLLISSEELPDWNKRLLEKLLSEYNWAEIHYLPSKGMDISQPVYNDLEKYNDKVLFATIRLDDDDALSIDFIEEFERFFNESNSGYAVSFGLGLCGFYDFKKHQYNKLVETYLPKFSAGLCYINIYENGQYDHSIKTIYQAGAHSRVDLNVPTIIYSKKVMFIRTMYSLSDSYNPDKINKLFKLKHVDLKVIENRFKMKEFNSDFYINYNNKVNRI